MAVLPESVRMPVHTGISEKDLPLWARWFVGGRGELTLARLWRAKSSVHLLA
jgi:hypothetical protein